jgi:hypothetical protein
MADVTDPHPERQLADRHVRIEIEHLGDVATGAFMSTAAAAW